MPPQPDGEVLTDGNEAIGLERLAAHDHLSGRDVPRAG